MIEGAPARRCRIAIDGTTFSAAFPQVRWLVGDADLADWRGQLDYWVFLDGQLGQIAGSVNGEGAVIEPEALQGTDRGPPDGDGARTGTSSSILRRDDRRGGTSRSASATAWPGCFAS